jgi:hypothetical protein
MHYPVQDGISESWVREKCMPLVRRELTGYQQCTRSHSSVNNVQQNLCGLGGYVTHPGGCQGSCRVKGGVKQLF